MSVKFGIIYHRSKWNVEAPGEKEIRFWNFLRFPLLLLKFMGYLTCQYFKYLWQLTCVEENEKLSTLAGLQGWYDDDKMY